MSQRLETRLVSMEASLQALLRSNQAEMEATDALIVHFPL